MNVTHIGQAVRRDATTDSTEAHMKVRKGKARSTHAAKEYGTAARWGPKSAGR